MPEKDESTREEDETRLGRTGGTDLQPHAESAYTVGKHKDWKWASPAHEDKSERLHQGAERRYL